MDGAEGGVALQREGLGRDKGFGSQGAPVGALLLSVREPRAGLALHARGHGFAGDTWWLEELDGENVRKGGGRGMCYDEHINASMPQHIKETDNPGAELEKS